MFQILKWILIYLKGTIHNNLDIMVNQQGKAICTSTVPKTTTRHTAENSFISSMALLCVIAFTYCDISAELQRHEEKEISDNSKGRSFFHNIISKPYDNIPIQVVRSELLLSTNDTVNYIYEGKSKEKE